MLPVPFAVLLTTPFSPLIFTANPCLADRYFGTYGSDASAVFLADVSCVASLGSEFLSNSSAIIALPSKYDQLVWVEEIAVDPALKSDTDTKTFNVDLEDLVDRLGLWASQSESQAPSFNLQDNQDFESLKFSYSGVKIRTVWNTSTSAIICSSSETVTLLLDTALPRFWRAIPLPQRPLPSNSIPEEAIGRLKHVLADLTFNPDVAAIVNNISIPQMRNDIRFLTGEDGKSGIVSRHSFSEGSGIAAYWLKARLEETGASCTLQVFISGFAPNVICRYAAAVDTTATVVLGAHYDSRGSFGSVRAPGGNDDGSGTIALLSIARVLNRRARLRFRTNIEIVVFAGEEQGLLGSRHYARALREAKANITLMLQADMLGYRVPGEPPQLGLPDLYEIPEASHLIANISAIYSPELTVGSTPVCCSDHQSFYEQGFPAAQVFERAGRIADPMYHNSGDISEREGYDFEQIKSIAKVQFATLLHVAGFDIV